MSQSVERLVETILALSDSEKLRLLESLTNTLTVQAQRAIDGAARANDHDGREIVANSGGSIESDSSPPLDPNETTLETPITGTEPTGESRNHDSGSAAYAETVHFYKLLRPLSQGGMGRVWIARDIDLGRDVALTQFSAQFALNPDHEARFIFEAKTLANLEHPGVVGLYGQGRDSAGRPFFVTKLVSGETFSSEINRFHSRDSSRRRRSERPLELRRLLNAFIYVCNIVAYAHSRGVLHRDIKPQNVMSGKFGETLLVEWGLAKVLFLPDPKGDHVEDPSAIHPEDFHGATEFGVAVGTPGYMSPEQATGRNDLLEPATDIYSLGATLYEVLVGRPPFVGRKFSELIKDIAQGTFPKPREIDSDVPAILESVCLKAMARRPEDRYPSATALADDVERWLAGARVCAHPGREGKSLWPASNFLRRWWNRDQRREEKQDEGLGDPAGL
jgi:eukaryotic-like serine/threonine-protein kinase